MLIQTKQEKGCRKNKHVYDQIHMCGADRFIRYRLIIHFYNLDASRMDQMADFPDRGFDINDKTADLNSASGTARAGTYKHQHD